MAESKIGKKYGDLLELFIVIAFLFLIISIYVPRAIWDEEEYFEAKSRFNMENMYDVQTFYNSLLGQYTSDGLLAMKIVNSVRDSLTGDSTFLGDQTLVFDGEKITVDIPFGYDAEFDTTFGFPMVRRDTLLDTTLTIVMYSEVLSRNDTSYIQNKNLEVYKNEENFLGIIEQITSERVEIVNYYDSYLPDSSMFFCPVTDQAYEILIKNDGGIVRVESPIDDPVVESKYIIFSFKANNHGYIDDGSKSWD
ncbi:MAG: hypothetical protein V3S48_03145 [Candidatus Neomarinimicrobiota bacterium]